MTKTNIDKEQMTIVIVGHVDHGKSSVIGRLLADTNSLPKGKLEQVRQRCVQNSKPFEYAFLLDALKDEQAQGITIDSARSFFNTKKRHYIIFDAPGHIEFLKNMVTGAAHAEAALLVIDALEGIRENSRRHGYLLSMLGIKQIAVLVNKMDLVDYDQNSFDRIVEDFEAFSHKLDIPDIHYIPISALKGDNVVNKSEEMPWYDGSTLLYVLENVHIASDLNYVDCRFPVQRVIRPQSDEYHDFRGYAGRIEGGVFKPGDEVMAMPSGFTTTIESIRTMDEELTEAFPPMSVIMTLKDEIDISRGDMIVRTNNQPHVGQDIDLMVCWLNEKPLNPGGKYTIKHTTQDLRCIVRQIRYKVNINTLHRIEDDSKIGLNDIGRISIRTTRPIFYDNYRRNRTTGSMILVDEFTNETVVAGMILT